MVISSLLNKVSKLLLDVIEINELYKRQLSKWVIDLFSFVFVEKWHVNLNLNLNYYYYDDCLPLRTESVLSNNTCTSSRERDDGKDNVVVVVNNVCKKLNFDDWVDENNKMNVIGESLSSYSNLGSNSQLQQNSNSSRVSLQEADAIASLIVSAYQDGDREKVDNFYEIAKNRFGDKAEAFIQESINNISWGSNQQ